MCVLFPFATRERTQPPTVACKNGSSVGIRTRCTHFFSCFAPTCELVRCLLTKFLRRSSVGKSIKSALLVGEASSYMENLLVRTCYLISHGRCGKMTPKMQNVVVWAYMTLATCMPIFEVEAVNSACSEGHFTNLSGKERCSLLSNFMAQRIFPA